MTTPSNGRTYSLARAYGNECRAAHCNARRLPNHKFCQVHKFRLLYRGHEQQAIIRQQTIGFALKTVRLLVIDNRGSQAWSELTEALQQRWDSSRRYVLANLSQYFRDGKAKSKWERKGYQMVADIFQTVGFDKTLEIWAAFQYLKEDSPYLFIDEQSYRHQVIKYLRAKAKNYHSSAINPKTGKPRYYSSVLYQVEREVAYELLLGIFGAIGLRLHQQLQARADRLRANKEQIDRALRAIT